jgi:membrane associated rhomboid family serine protease
MIAVPRFQGFVRTFVFACVGVFILEMFARTGYPNGERVFEQFIRFFGLVPDLFFSGMIYQPLTWIFLHGSTFHLLFNMLAFWMFGSLLQETMGERKFVKFVFITAFITGVIVATAGLWTPSMSQIPTIGASGVVFAILIAVSRLFPHQVVLFMFIFPMKLKYFAYILIALEFYALYSSNNHGISNTAHLAGAFVGWIYVSMMDQRGGRQGGSGPSFWSRLRTWKDQWRQRRLRKRLRIVRGPENRQWN